MYKKGKDTWGLRRVVSQAPPALLLLHTLALRWPSLAFVSGGEPTLDELSWVGRRWPTLAIVTAAAVAVTGAGAR